jgi:hypothetical protein
VAKKIGIGVLATLLCAAAAGPAPAGAQSRQTFSGTFTTQSPGSSSGYVLKIDYRNPQDAHAKPHSVQTVLQTLHHGTRIDTSVPQRCTASDAQLVAQGESACPPGSRVGGGHIAVDTGMAVGLVPRVIENRLVVFNADRALILFTESTNTPGSPIRVSSRTTVGDRTFTSQSPPAPGFPPPDPFLAIKRVRLTLSAVSTGSGAHRRNFITTPGFCPSTGRWTNTATFTYRDGVSQTVASASPCRRIFHP